MVEKEKSESPKNFGITQTDLFSNRFGDFFKYRLKFQPSIITYPLFKIYVYSHSKLSVTLIGSGKVATNYLANVLIFKNRL